MIDRNLALIFKGELRPEISLLHMKVLTLIKAKSNVFLWYVQCCSCTRRSKTKILTTKVPPSSIEFDVVTSQRQTQSGSDCVMLLESITWDSQTIFLAFARDQWMQEHGNQQSQTISKMSCLTVWRHNGILSPRWRRTSHQYFGFRPLRAATALHVSKKNITFCFNQG